LGIHSFGPVIEPPEEESGDSNSEKFTSHIVSDPYERKIKVITEEETKAGCLGTPVERKEKEPEGKDDNLPLEKIVAVVEEFPSPSRRYGKQRVNKGTGKSQKSQRLEGERKIQRKKDVPREEGTEGKANHPHAIEQSVTESLLSFSP